MTVFNELRAAGFQITAVEQSPSAISLPDFAPPDKLALLVGREVEGVEPEVLAMCDATLEIPMFGHKRIIQCRPGCRYGAVSCPL